MKIFPILKVTIFVFLMCIHECEFNQSISKFEGRSQFNFDFGNYSKEKDEILSQYIIKTQELTKEEK